MAGVIQFYEGQNIFVTGASGFLGKVLLEKLLRACPDVGNIFVLVRPKKGKEPSERVQDFISLPLFDLIRRDRPEKLRKILPLTGDCEEIGLGLSTTDRKILEETVSVVFHAAATIRFDAPLKSAVMLNTRGTREIMMIARNMKNLKVIVHVSTMYCNCDRPAVQEIIYPPHADWKDIISIAEHFDEHTLNILTPKILCNLPNTYTFSKSLAEHVVKDLGEDLPVVIFRPSIVISSWNEPFPGWIDNFNGPVGLMIGSGKGILRTVFADPNRAEDYIPIDICIQFLLLAAWFKAVGSETSQPAVYNAIAHPIKRPAFGEGYTLSVKLTEEVPFNSILWKPRLVFTKYQAWYYVNVILFHLIPGVLIDGLLKICGKKPRLIRLHRSIYIANMALSFFTTRSWVFTNDKLLWLRTQVPPCDSKHFLLDRIENLDQKSYIINAIWGAKLYLLNESKDTFPQARRHFKRMHWLDKSVRTVAITLLLWFGYHSTLLQSTVSGIFTSSVFG